MKGKLFRRHDSHLIAIENQGMLQTACLTVASFSESNTTYKVFTYDKSNRTGVTFHRFDNWGEMDRCVKEHLSAQGIDYGSLEVVDEMSTILIDDSWMEPRKARFKYGNGYCYDPMMIPLGRQAHVGKGIWMTRCRYCTHAVAHYGPMAEYACIGRHEINQHPGAQVPGINVGIAP